MHTPSRTPSEERLLKMAILGSSGPLRADGGHMEDPKELSTSFEWDQAVAHSFCMGCGRTFEVNQEWVDNMLERLKLPPYKKTTKDKYFRVGCCTACDSQQDTVELLPLPERS